MPFEEKSNMLEPHLDSRHASLFMNGVIPRIAASLALALCCASATAFEPARGPNIENGPQELFAPHQASLIPYLRLASWDVDGFDSSRDLVSIAEVVSRFDLVSFQGLSPGSVELVDEVSKAASGLSGVEWRSAMQSYTGSKKWQSGKRTLMAFLWRSDRVAFSGRSGNFEDGGIFERLPYGAEFSFKGKPLLVASIDSVDTNSVLLAAESQLLPKVVSWLASSSSANPPIFIVGNFNCPPDHQVLSEFSRLMRPLVSKGSLISRTGAVSNKLVDQIWTNSLVPMRAGAYPYAQVLGMTNKQAARVVSNHLPIFALVDIR